MEPKALFRVLNYNGVKAKQLESRFIDKQMPTVNITCSHRFLGFFHADKIKGRYKIMKKELNFLKELSSLPGIPGNEKAVRNYLKEYVKPYADSVETDNLGSLIAKKGQKGPHVMIAGHMDEIGLMVTQITKDGFLKFQTVGGWFSQVMLAQEWEVHTNKGIIYGITGVKPPHIIPADKRKQAIEIDTMFIDIGVKDKDEALELGVRIGDMIVPHTTFKVFGKGSYLMNKAWDNRIGSAVVAQALKQVSDFPNQLFGVFTVQEEVGLRGAKTSSYMVKPDIAIAVDTGLANDVPGGDPVEQSLGKGPQILFYDGGLIAHRALREFVINVAKEENIPYQESYIVGGRTDAGHMHLAHHGAAAISLCVPTRYMHSHTSIIHYEDYQNTIKLLVAVIKRLDQKTVEQILAD